MGDYPGPSEPQSRGGSRANLQPKSSLQGTFTLDQHEPDYGRHTTLSVDGSENPGYP